MSKYDQLKPKLDVHQAVTDKIIAAIEKGAGTFEMPWHRPGTSFDIPENALTRQRYRGSNILSLWIDADEKKFEHQTWATFKQWQQLDAQVRKGEKGSLIVKYGEWKPRDDRRDETGTPADDNDTSKLMFAKAAWVFNVAQVDGYPIPTKTPRADLTTRLANVDAYIANTGADIRHGGQRAFYRHRGSDGQGDFIQMPDRELFTGTATSSPTEAYYATLLHELGHLTGAEHRLNRQHGKRFGDQAYAFEELLAEMHAAFQCAALQVTNEPRADHAQYIAHWLKILKDDKKAIFSAASMATQAVNFLDALQSSTTSAGDKPSVPKVKPQLQLPGPA